MTSLKATIVGPLEKVGLQYDANLIYTLRARRSRCPRRTGPVANDPKVSLAASRATNGGTFTPPV